MSGYFGITAGTGDATRASGKGVAGPGLSPIQDWRFLPDAPDSTSKEDSLPSWDQFVSDLELPTRASFGTRKKTSAAVRTAPSRHPNHATPRRNDFESARTVHAPARLVFDPGGQPSSSVLHSTYEDAGFSFTWLTFALGFITIMALVSPPSRTSLEAPRSVALAVGFGGRFPIVVRHGVSALIVRQSLSICFYMARMYLSSRSYQWLINNSVVSPSSRCACAFVPEVRPYRGHSKDIVVISPRLAVTDGIFSRFVSSLPLPFPLTSVRNRTGFPSRSFRA
ncbi:hypothetical protein EDB84DRAFT_1440949 [Lactarius hengduanensis]|nr:hypothetical protein EDB84DRAFT_1440949 [Lactarius hengduanensis]